MEAVNGVLGVFIALRVPGGVAGLSPESGFEFNDLIFAEVGVLNGSRFRGGSLSVWTFFLLSLRCGWGLGSVST